MSQSDNLNDFRNYLSFVEARRRRWRIFLSATEFIVVVLLTAAVVSFPAYVLRTKYFLNPSGLAKATAPATPPDAYDSAQSTTSGDAKAPQKSEVADAISIAKIGLSAPITWNVAGEQTKLALQNGAIHLAGSALPGTPGNTFITGHSSDYWWTPGGYKSIFALLDKIEANDEISISYRGNTFNYRVYGIEVVPRDDIKRFMTANKPETLTLMTCWPVGTNWKRLMVQAERID